MAAYAEVPNSPLREEKHRRHERKKRMLRRYFLAGLLVGVLCFGALDVCRRATQRLWSDIQASAPPLNTDILFLSTSPQEKETDSLPPELSGVKDITAYQGDDISWLDGVTATDNMDATPRVTVDTSGVDLSTPGIYTALYTATDASGNATQAEIRVTVLEKREGYQDLATIYAEADAFLLDIVAPGDSVRQQVANIYAWARTSLSYGGHSDREDWYQTAYTMLTEGRGDCFGFFAVTKLLFERLGIPNIDVQKVRNYEDDSDHFWSLVSLDGGQTWYHFDATPRYGSGDDFCLVTDAFLDAYSDAHRGSHNRDKSLYPATP